MRERQNVRILIGAICLIGLVTLTCSAQSGVFGTWKLNLAKSEFGLGPPPRTSTQRVDPVQGGEKSVTNTVDSMGNMQHVEFTAIFDDGKDYPVTGDPTRDAISVKKIDDFTH